MYRNRPGRESHGWGVTARDHCPIVEVDGARASAISAAIVIAMIEPGLVATRAPARASDDDKKPNRPPPKQKQDTGVALEERTRTKKPPMYKVLLHNDDYTTKEFVVFVLQSVFQRSETDALAIMTHVHNQGVGVAGVYTFEIAETKVQKTVELARTNEYPLQLSIEPSE